MTNNPTIDGVSRELLQRWLDNADFFNHLDGMSMSSIDEARKEDERILEELRALLDTPVVERQPVEGYLPKDGGWSFKRHNERTIVVMNGDNWTSIQADNGPIYEQFLYRFCESQMDQISPEVADLQSTIAQLQDQLAAQKENLESAVNNSIMFAEKADELQARVAELEIGRGKPVAWRTGSIVWAYEPDARRHSEQHNIKVTPLFTAQPAPVAMVHPFAERIISKLRRFNECASDFESDGVDIGRHWLDMLTQLGLLNRAQRSPALWEITQQGEDCLDATAALNGERG